MTTPTEDRPLVTFALFAYNQENYIREAVEGAFSQTYSPLEIILSDDCSSDGTFKIMKEMARGYQGPHLVKVRRGERNLGVAGHFDDLMRLASGDFFVAAAGDDVSDPARTTDSLLLINNHEDIGFVEVKCKNFSGDYVPRSQCLEPIQLDPSRHRLFSIQDVLSGNVTGYTGAGRTYRRDAYIRFPPLIEGCPAEDTPALFRCLYGGSGALIDRQLVARRIHDRNLSSQESLSKMNMPLMASQYHRDLDMALRLNLIDQSEHRVISKGIDRYTFRKNCAIDVHNGFIGSIKLIDMLRSQHFSTREKLYLLRVWLITKFKKYIT